jgi:serine/threonine-protein kinase SRPK3
MVKIDPNPELIEKLIKDNPSESYPPRFYPKISPDPIITVKSQPLPNFGLHTSLDNLTIKLMD